MEDQSPHVSSTHDAPQPDNQQELYREAEEPQPYAKPWDDDDDVLDLTGGQYNHPAFNVTFPTKPAEAEEEEDKRSYSDSLELSPESEEPSSIGSDVPRAPVIPSAPVEEHDTPVSPYSAPTSGSVDVNLFPLPASSAPLMQSSADNVMDLQQPSSTQPDGKEDLSSLLFESTTTLPSLSPLSPDYPKEHTGTIAFSADSATPEALQSYAAETAFIEEKDQKYMFGVGGIKEDAIFSDRGFSVEHPTSQQEYVPVDHEKMYTQSAKEMFSGMLKSVVPPHEEFSDLKEGADEHYVDFKPFVSTGVLELGYEFKEKAADVKNDLSNWDFESIKPEGQYFEEKDIDISDDISPASPEAISESSSYETFAPLQKTAPLAYGGNPFADHKFEKGVEELETGPKTHLGSNVATVNPFLEHLDIESEYVTSDSVSGNVAAQAPSKTEGLTPDLVQEAYESEVYDDGVPKLNYEPKIDLVQTIATASQENIPPTTQNTSMFENSDSVSSPVLPDIVMEAPLTSASQPDVSTAGPVGVVSEEKIKFESEKPPSYEDTVNKASFREQEPAAVHFEAVKAVQSEEVEAPYISIACDLIKETIPEKVTDFPKALKSDFDSQYTAYDESSPESEPSEPSYKHWETEVILSEAATTISSVKSHDFTLEKEKESDQKWNEEVSSKAYLESETRVFDTNMSTKEPVKPLSSQEKPLQMEAFGKTVYSEEAPRITKPVYFEKPSALPFVEEFVLKPSKEDQVEDKKQDDFILKDEPKKTEDLHPQQKPKERVQEFDNLADFSKASEIEETISKPAPPTKGADEVIPSSTGQKQPPAPPSMGACNFKTPVVDLLYWRDIKKSGLVFGASLFLLLSLTVFSIVSVSAYIALALLSVTISFRIYKGVLQAIQKSEEGHPFKSCLDSNVQVSEELVNKYSNLALGHVNCTLKELRRLFLVEDLVDSLKFAVLMWVFTYIGALFNGLTLLILALISLFSIPVLYERHQTKVDHYLGLISKNFNNIRDLILAKIPGLKRKTE